MGRSKTILNRDAQWNEVSSIPVHKKTPFAINSVLFFTVSRKGSISKARTSQLCRLLLIGLNRRMPNGTYGGVRGATS